MKQKCDLARLASNWKAHHVLRIEANLSGSSPKLSEYEMTMMEEVSDVETEPFPMMVRDGITSGQTPILSRFIWAFGPGSTPGINNSGPMLVPVGPRTGTEEAPRGQARSEGGRGHRSRLIGRTGTEEAPLLALFSDFFSFIYFVFCIQLNGTIYI